MTTPLGFRKAPHEPRYLANRVNRPTPSNPVPPVHPGISI
ncbi:hypothetical protein HMPREF0577_0236 [Mobiluncus mulieris ATCC 35243]|nr:hypothetical protein HMPREF0577_0236 [Mobiluncus mulieris ATCC 35243]